VAFLLDIEEKEKGEEMWGANLGHATYRSLWGSGFLPRIAATLAIAPPLTFAATTRPQAAGLIHYRRRP